MAVPFLLWNGAMVWEPYMKLDPVCSPAWGIALVLVGTVLMVGSMISLKRQGDGLPMRYTPRRRVTEKNHHKGNRRTRT